MFHASEKPERQSMGEINVNDELDRTPPIMSNNVSNSPTKRGRGYTESAGGSVGGGGSGCSNSSLGESIVCRTSFESSEGSSPVNLMQTKDSDLSYDQLPSSFYPGSPKRSRVDATLSSGMGRDTVITLPTCPRSYSQPIRQSSLPATAAATSLQNDEPIAALSLKNFNRSRGEGSRSRSPEVSVTTDLKTCPQDESVPEALPVMPDSIGDDEVGQPHLSRGQDTTTVTFPPPYEVGSDAYSAADENWMVTKDSSWMYSTTDNSYYHPATDSFYTFDESQKTFLPVVHEIFSLETSDLLNDRCADDDDDEGGKDMTTAGGTPSESEDSLDLDFKDILGATAAINSSTPGKAGREDRHITRHLLPLDAVAETSCCCVLSAIYDGHGGFNCAEYCVNHLVNNLIAGYRDSRRTLARKLERHITKRGRNASLRKLGIYRSEEAEALCRGLTKAFETTNANYLHLCEKKGQEDGSTALVLLIYGPDSDGNLKFITANAGDCRAVLCRDFRAMRLTTDHKPDLPSERERIVASGGRVVLMRDVWRVTISRGKRIFGLATARSIGDLPLKRPLELVTAVPDVAMTTADLENDMFIILASDGVWDVIPDQEACDIVLDVLPTSKDPLVAAQSLVNLASQRGSTDDKTATVLYFGWHPTMSQQGVRDVAPSFPPSSPDKNALMPDQNTQTQNSEIDLTLDTATDVNLLDKPPEGGSHVDSDNIFAD